MIDSNNEDLCPMYKYWQNLSRPTSFLIMMVPSKAELSKKIMPPNIRLAKTALRNLGYFLEEEYRLTKYGLGTANLHNIFVQTVLDECCKLGVKEAVIFTDIPNLTKKILPSLSEAIKERISIVDVNELYDTHSSEYAYYLSLIENDDGESI